MTRTHLWDNILTKHGFEFDHLDDAWIRCDQDPIKLIFIARVDGDDTVVRRDILTITALYSINNRTRCLRTAMSYEFITEVTFDFMDIVLKEIKEDLLRVNAAND